MKKYLPALLLALTAAFISCEKNDDQELRGTIIGLIDEVKITNVRIAYDNISDVVFVARIHIPSGAPISSYESDESRYMLRASFDKETMTLQLPHNPPQSLLRSIADDIPAGFNISDPAANTISFTEIGGCAAGSDKVLGRIVYCKRQDDVRHELSYIYCDRSVTVTGTEPDWWGNSTTYNLKLEKGWNMAVEKTTWKSAVINKTVTNFLPGGMEWVYDMLIGDR